MLFEVRNISKSFKKVPVIENFSLKVEQGDMIALVGKRRKGKTTLMQMLAGIIPVDEGEIYYKGKLVGSKGCTAGLCRLRKRKIGYITTEAILMPDMTVYENLAMAQLNAKGRLKEKRNHAKEVLRNLGLKGKGRFFPNELSTLDKQKVCVARAIINDPEILICDEPTDILEGYGAEQLMDILEILNSAGYTIIVSTHSKRIASRFRKVYPVHEGLDLTGLNVVTEEEPSYEEDEESYYENDENDIDETKMPDEEWEYLSGVEKTEESEMSEELESEEDDASDKEIEETSEKSDDAVDVSMKEIIQETDKSESETAFEEKTEESNVSEEKEELPEIDFSGLF